MPASADVPRGRMTNIFPSPPIFFLLSLFLTLAGGAWFYCVASYAPPPGQSSHPISFLSGESITLEKYGQLTALSCGERQIDAADLSHCNLGQSVGVQFTYLGRQLWLELRRGEEFGQLLATVDGSPANLIKVHTSVPEIGATRAGRIPMYSPFEHASMRPASEWIPVHREKTYGRHRVFLELRPGPAEEELAQPRPAVMSIGIDLQSPFHLPYWPGLLLSIMGGMGLFLTIISVENWPAAYRFSWRQIQNLLRFLYDLLPSTPLGLGLLLGLALLAVFLGQLSQQWWLSLTGLSLLGMAGLQRPSLWLGSVLLGLPFYLYPIPLLPGFAFNLVEIGAWGALTLTALQYFRLGPGRLPELRRGASIAPLVLALSVFTVLALFSALEAEFQTPALREWRSVFLASFVFLCATAMTLRMSEHPEADASLVLILWISGAVVISLFGYYSFVKGEFITDVDGVRRIRGLFGSPNNLALYLERTLLVTTALFLFARAWPKRILWGFLVAVQAGAMLLTFSKGGLFLGVPSGLLFLFGTVYFLRSRIPEAGRVMWILGGVTFLGLLSLIPFLGTPRFAGLLDWQRNFPNFVRIHLWRSGLQMFLDNWLLGVGPDNFLYWYRGTYLDPAVWNEPSLNHPHNFLIDILSRLGMAGLFAGLAFFGTGLAVLRRQFQGTASNRLALGLTAACVAGLAHGMVDASYALPELMFTWTMLFGLACKQDLNKTAGFLT